jgi:hypothetical protein
MSESENPASSAQPWMESAPALTHEARPVAAAVDPVLERLEYLIESVLMLPPPSVPCANRQWRQLFNWCIKYRYHLGTHARRCLKHGSQTRVDVWLCELASPPKGLWEGVRHGLLPFIRLVGLTPRGDGQPMFTVPAEDQSLLEPAIHDDAADMSYGYGQTHGQS